jgi:hypothetical protein
MTTNHRPSWQRHQSDPPTRAPDHALLITMTPDVVEMLPFRIRLSPSRIEGVQGMRLPQVAGPYCSGA